MSSSSSSPSLALPPGHGSTLPQPVFPNWHELSDANAPSPDVLETFYTEHRNYISKWSSYYFQENKYQSAIDYFENRLSNFSDRLCIRYAHHVDQASQAGLTYQQLNQSANQVATWALAHKLDSVTFTSQAQKPVVCMLMENCPSFICTWMGLAKVGLTIALLNTSVTPLTLKYALEAAQSNVLIISQKFKPLWNEVLQLYQQKQENLPTVFWSAASLIDVNPGQFQRDTDNQTGQSVSLAQLDLDVCFLSAYQSYFPSSISNDHFTSYRATILADHPLFYIYTSGTTGLSKAALFSHRRFVGAGITWAYPMELTPNDVYYIPLPLFHGNGGVVAVSAVFQAGCSMLIRDKFSVSAFWKDVAMYQCTAMIHVGEVWRYLHNAAIQMKTNATNQQTLTWNTTLRAICGNGLRADIWAECAELFSLKRIVEHYGMTEMPAGPYISFYGKIGACGYIPTKLWEQNKADKLIQYDVEQEMIARDPAHSNFATEVDQGECVFLLARGTHVDASVDKLNPHTEGGTSFTTLVATKRENNNQTSTTPSSSSSSSSSTTASSSSSVSTDIDDNPKYKPYQGYTLLSACSKRVYRHLFEIGDAWFSTGDILKHTRTDGFWTFVDRIGDTFRRKGENVATNEVAEIVCSYTQTQSDMMSSVLKKKAIKEANVYGIKYKEDGKAGMACLALADDVILASHVDAASQIVFDINQFTTYCLNHLAPYAIPVYLRILPTHRFTLLSSSTQLLPSALTQSLSELSSIDNPKTATLKFQKYSYVLQGFDLSLIQKHALKQTVDLLHNIGIQPTHPSLQKDVIDSINLQEIKKTATTATADADWDQFIFTFQPEATSSVSSELRFRLQIHVDSIYFYQGADLSKEAIKQAREQNQTHIFNYIPITQQQPS